MRKTTMTLAVAASTVFASQAVMAYQAGDVYVRGSFEKAEVTTDNISDENAFYLSGGYLFHDKMGVELGVGESVEHDFFGLAGNDLGTMERMPVNLLVNYYPLGGIEEARVQPFVGLGVNYTRYSSIDEVAPYDIDIDDDYGVVGQVGVDLTLTSNLSATGYARWADVDAEVDNHGQSIGKVKVDPVTVGAGLTYRF
ncbi:OmpW family protein [Halomonas sp. KAO]|uniref:OmpW/AlkL family protein n=1 Tax=Halomonas sp. KAO TaxID=2783858 RepID=UPI00189E35D8|nr:OmpW family outer membrane protein [Halomonas sp. KAO]MBF7051779.1 OmpW family protein [Halomonas sp. KAO]